MPGAADGGAEALRPRRHALRTVAALLACLARRAAGEAGESVQGTVKYLWPIHFSSVPLTTREKDSLDPPEMGDELAAIGLARFEEYLKSTLPKELRLDEPFAEGFKIMDHSRVNLAFNRWQKRVFAETTGIPIEEILQQGEAVPERLEGINYTWPELYESKAFKRLRQRMAELTRLYNRRSGFPAGSHADGPRFRVFPWVEVFKKGDALRPGSRTDAAYAMGRYFPQVTKGSLKLNFEDPRGINPPYGKTFSHAAYDGNLVLYPTWVSHFITPNMYDRPAVCYCFLLYPSDGKTLSWKDDVTADIIVTRRFQATSKQARK